MVKETVLCIKRSELPGTWLKEKSVVPMSLDLFVNYCDKAGFKFIDRELAERQPDLKQIIPYIILQTKDRKRTAVYNRQGSEKRLHDLWSIGIGGHINPIDSVNSYMAGSNRKQSVQNQSFREILMAGMHRELNEELLKKNKADSPQFIGVINEDLTEVGKVHLGAVFGILTDSPETYHAGPELFQFNWMDTEKLHQLNMELWSILALDLGSKWK
jgi:predicted NUDIX family phosphoesterase